jgi:hypothetical protein
MIQHSRIMYLHNKSIILDNENNKQKQIPNETFLEKIILWVDLKIRCVVSILSMLIYTASFFKTGHRVLHANFSTPC